MARCVLAGGARRGGELLGAVRRAERDGEPKAAGAIGRAMRLPAGVTTSTAWRPGKAGGEVTVVVPDPVSDMRRLPAASSCMNSAPARGRPLRASPTTSKSGSIAR